MPTKAHGPLLEDINRHIKAAKKAGGPGVVVFIGRATIVIPFDGAYLAKLAEGHLPAPDTEEKAREPHNWKSW